MYRLRSQSLAKRVKLAYYYNGHWFSLSSALVTAAGAGTAYAFGTFSQSLKEALKYNQEQVDLVGSISEVGSFLGILAGLSFTYCGPRTTLLLGGLMTTLGFLCLSLYASHSLDSSVGVVCLMAFIAMLGNSFRTTAATAIAVCTFPESDRGKVVGLTKGFYALGASIFSEFYVAFFNQHVAKFLLFVSILTLLLLVICIVPFRVVKTNPSTKFVFYSWYRAIGILAFYLIALSVLQNSIELNTGWKTLGAIGTVICFGALFTLPMRIEPSQFLYSMTDLKEFEDSEGLASSDEEESPLQSDKTADKVSEMHLTLNQAARTVNFYLLFFIFMCCSGSGLVVINNISQLNYAWTEKSNPQLYVCIIGVGNFIGRIAIGYWSDQWREKIPRSIFLFICVGGMSISQLGLSTGQRILLVPCVALCSFCFGGCFSIVPTLTADLFGSKHFAENYGALDLAPALGTVIFATGIVNWVYRDIETESGSIENCVGVGCFQVTFFLTSFFSLLASFLSILLARRIQLDVQC